jgi:hypothetical protein
MRFVHVFDLTAAVFADHDDPDKDMDPEVLLQAFEKRIAYLREHPGVVREACGYLATYEE